MLVRWLCLFAMVVGMGCGGSHKTSSGKGVSTSKDAGEGSSSRDCVDGDGDGYGDNCSLGRDCDDNDDQITDECRRCVQPTIDCPCEPGTKPLKCDPHYTKKVEGGTLVCSEGTRYCRDGAYSDCEILSQYVMFVSD